MTVTSEPTASSSATTDPGRTAKIQLLLPLTPVDIYVEGVLVISNAIGKYEFNTPDLPAGFFKYRIVITSSYDKTKKGGYELNGISAGKNLTADLRKLI